MTKECSRHEKGDAFLGINADGSKNHWDYAGEYRKAKQDEKYEWCGQAVTAHIPIILGEPQEILIQRTSKI